MLDVLRAIETDYLVGKAESKFLFPEKLRSLPPPRQPPPIPLLPPLSPSADARQVKKELDRFRLLNEQRLHQIKKDERRWTEEERAREKGRKNYIAQIQRYHSCCMTCRFEHVHSANKQFFVGEKLLCATGEVYVCNATLLVHQCGSMCRNVVVGSEGSVCGLTGICMDRLVSLARSGKDRDTLMCGGVTYVQSNYGFHASDTQDNADDAQQEHGVADADLDEFAKDDYEEHFKREADGSFGASLNDFSEGGSGGYTREYCEEVMKRDKVEAIFFYRLFPTNARDVDYVLWMHGKLNVQELVLKILERCEWRKQAEHAWKVRVHGEEYMKILEAEAYEASRQYNIWLVSYIRECHGRGEAASRVVALNKYLDDVVPKYNGVFIGDVTKLNEANKLYFVETMMNIWDCYMRMPEVASSGVRFDDCCTAILSKLRTGYCISVYMVDDDENDDEEKRPRQSSSLTLRQQNNAQEVKIQLIDAHPELHLVSSTIVRNVQNRVTKARHSGRDTTMLVSECWTGARISTGRRQLVMNKTRAAAQKSNNAPPMKRLHTVFAKIVENAKTLKELRSYCQSSISTQSHQQSYLRRMHVDKDKHNF